MKRKLVIFSWAMYDFANTIFAMNVISLYFALWVTIDKQGQDIFYSIALSGSMLFAALSAPILGAISDKIGRRMPFLIVFTVICCLFTATISFIDSLIIGLLCFAVANYCFQISDVFYNSLLPDVSEEQYVATVSGIGTGLGYFGTIAGLLLVAPFILKYGRGAAFLPTALYFFIFALPCFIFVKEKPKRVRAKIHFSAIKQYPNLLRFLIAAFIFLNAINTAYVFMSIYIKKLAQFSEGDMLLFYMVSSMFAIIGAFVTGVISDKWGAKKTLVGVLLLWCCGTLLAIVAYNHLMFWLVGPIIGISLGGTWTSARVLVVKLAPKEMIGEVFGFYGLVGKTATIIGPLLWGLTVLAFDSFGLLKYRIAVFVLFLFLIAGVVLLRMVK